MTKSCLLRAFCVVVGCVAIGLAPQSAFAQRGGGHGGGGGGFHGGGGGFHSSAAMGYHGGGSVAYGGARYGGGYYGRGGYYGGYRGYGRGYGYPGYGYGRYGYGWGWGWGWGLGLSWGWPYYWYPYGYGYSPYWYPYYPYYPYYSPYGYPYPDNGGGDPPPADSAPRSRDNAPVKPSATPAPGSSPTGGAMSASLMASARRGAAPYTTNGTTAARDYRPASSGQAAPPARPEVQNAMRMAREMPPAAFQRRIDAGRYSDFSPQEREMVNNAAQFQLAWEKP